MNQLQKVFDSITDKQLFEMISDYKILEKTGILPSGSVRDFTHMISNEFTLTYHDSSNCVKSAVINRAAFKWADEFKSKSI